MKKVHYDTGKALYMPISGRHSILLCGMSVQDTAARTCYQSEHVVSMKTTDPKLVTCIRCLSKLNKRGV